MMHLAGGRGRARVDRYSMYGDETVPSSTSNDNSGIMCGVRFYSDKAGKVTHIRYYRPSGSTGPHTVHLWDADTQALLGSGTNMAGTDTYFAEDYAAEDYAASTLSEGWQVVPLDTPVDIQAGKDYVASYLVDQVYARHTDYFLQSYQNGPIHFPAHETGRPNGMYLYTGAVVFPSDTWNECYYWVDPVLEVTTIIKPPQRGIPGEPLPLPPVETGTPEVWVSSANTLASDSTQVTWRVHLSEPMESDLLVNVSHSATNNGQLTDYQWVIPAGNTVWSGTYTYVHANMGANQDQVIFRVNPGSGYTVPDTAVRPRQTDAPVSSGSGTPVGLIYEETFEDGIAFEGQHIQNAGFAHSLQVVSDVTYQGQYAARFELKPDDPIASGGTRSEILFNGVGELSGDMWYGVAMYFPVGGWPEDSASDTLMQWWQTSSSSQSMTFRTRDNELYFQIRDESGQTRAILCGPVVEGEWVEWIIHIKHSTGSDGLVEVWRNGTKQGQYAGMNTYPSYGLPELKLGVYKASWNNGTTNADARIVYYDEIRIADATGGYWAVDPAGDPASGGGGQTTQTPMAIPDPAAVSYSDAPIVLSNSDIVGGQILIEGKRIQVTDGMEHCIDARAVSTRCRIIIRDCILRSPGMHIFGEYARHDWEIENNIFFGRKDLSNSKGDWGRWGVRITNPYTARIEHNYFAYTGGVRIEYTGGVSGCAGHKIRYNKMDEVYQPDGLLNFISVVATSVPEPVPEQEIAWNECWNTPGECWVEDTINIYSMRAPASSPALIHSNFLSGAFKDPATTSYTGGGIILDGTDRAVENFVLEDNIVVRNGNYCLAMACAKDSVIRYNYFAVARKFADGTTYPFWTSGIWSDDYSKSLQLASGNQVYENTGGAVGQGGVRKDYNNFDQYDGVPDHTVYSNNTSLAEVTRATEDAYEQMWLDRKATADVVCGPVQA